ncbi:MAG: PAS domain-containing sensor histidine kinase [Chloroflexota bacterium]|nr:PAS domain-containing sensor histidine kinase [Chloroflexota bacterium]
MSERQQAEQALRAREERFPSLIVGSDIVLLVDASGTVRYVSPSIQRVLGYRPEEYVGGSGFEHIHPDDVVRVFDKLTEILDNPGKAHVLEFRVQHKDGSWRYIEARANNLLDESISVGSIVVNSSDITERKRAEETRSRLAAIVEGSDDAIIGKTLDGVITDWNSGAEKLYGYSAEEVVGQHVSMLAPADRLDEILSLLERLRRGERIERISHYETIRMTKHGKLLDVSLTLSPINDLNGNIIGAATIARDISKSKEAERELAQALAMQQSANEELERINKLRKDFVSIVSHEFRTALTGIQGFSQMMRDEDFSVEEMRELSSDIYEDAKRLSRMISDMLDLDRMESGPMTLNLERVGLNEILARVTDQMRPNAPRHQIALQLDEALPELLGDRDKLTQVIVNLLNNAVKYSPDGGEVIVASHLEGDFAHVRVQDEGVSIEPEALKKLFVPYTRLESGATRHIQGTGLGLAICRQIIELHGGDIWVESRPGEGSTFHFTIPIKSSQPTVR